MSIFKYLQQLLVMSSMSGVDLIIKTRKEFERVAASHIKELLGPGAEAVSAPGATSALFL
jgi:hypothetical protein